jgi:tetratricopeptide (TPR) repeat protein
LSVAARATRIAQFLGDEAAVNQLVERWLTQEPDNPEAGRLAGIMALRRGAGARAFDYFFEAAQEGMTIDFGMLARAYPQLPIAEQQSLKSRIDAKLDVQPMQSLIFARALMATEDQDDETALEIVDQLLSNNPEDLQALMLQARLRLNLQRPNPLEALEQAVDKNPENAPLRHHFARLLSNSDPKKARAQYELLSAGDPRNGEYLLSLGLLNMELQDLLAAKAYLRQCLELESTGGRSTLLHGRNRTAGGQCSGRR